MYMSFELVYNANAGLQIDLCCQNRVSGVGDVCPHPKTLRLWANFYAMRET